MKGIKEETLKAADELEAVLQSTKFEPRKAEDVWPEAYGNLHLKASCFAQLSKPEITADLTSRQTTQAALSFHNLFFKHEMQSMALLRLFGCSADGR